jgi:hypothetical protein
MREWTVCLRGVLDGATGCGSRWNPGAHDRSARTPSDQTSLPGEYFAYAMDLIEPGQEHDPEFLDRIQTPATRFELGEGQKQMLSLKLHTTR